MGELGQTRLNPCTTMVLSQRLSVIGVAVER